jgi:hypothetical protein
MIQKTNSTNLERYPDHISAEDAARALSVMLGAGLKTYGQQPGVDGWFLVLRSKGITRQELSAAVEHFACRVGIDGNPPNFPAAGEFAGWIIQRRDERERNAAMQAEIALQDAETDTERRRRFLACYGTENPTKEQIDERFKEVFGTTPVKALQSGKFNFSPGRVDLIDAEHQARVMEQVRGFKEQP